MEAIRRFWAKSVINKITLLMSFSLVFCCCGWSGRIGVADTQISAVETQVQP